MTARCVRVVQNRRFFPPRTYLEKDVAPSVLSSGGALSIELSFSDKRLSGAQSIVIGMLHQRTIGRSITTYGSLRATPKNPMGKAEILLSPCIPINQCLVKSGKSNKILVFIVYFLLLGFPSCYKIFNLRISARSSACFIRLNIFSFIVWNSSYSTGDRLRRNSRSILLHFYILK